MKRIIAIVICMLFCSMQAFAGGEKTGEAGFMFLKVPMGAKETAMGSTGLTQSAGAGAIYWNPANISVLDQRSFAFSNINYFAGIGFNSFALALPIEDFGTFGVSINYVNWGSIDVTTEEFPDGTGARYTPYEMSLAVGYSKQITDRVSGGVTFKYLSSKISDVSANGVAFDFGFTYNTGYRGLKFGFLASNFGMKSKYSGDGMLRSINTGNNNQQQFVVIPGEPFELPASVSFGASMDMYRNESLSFVGSLEEAINNFQSNMTHFGLEFGYKNIFFLRGGYLSSFKKNADYTNLAGSTGGMSAGAGLNYKFTDNYGMSVDYAFSDLGVLKTVHRVSLGITF